LANIPSRLTGQILVIRWSNTGQIHWPLPFQARPCRRGHSRMRSI
jgi:hypothetical protein